MNTSVRSKSALASAAVACALCAGAALAEGDDPVVQTSKQSQALSSAGKIVHDVPNVLGGVLDKAPGAPNSGSPATGTTPHKPTTP